MSPAAPATPYLSSTVSRTEVFDQEAALNLIKHDGVAHETRKELSRYRKRATNANHVRIDYTFGKKWLALGVGRLTPTPYTGLAVFPREVRAALAQRYYWDVDIVNAQPTVLLTIAKEFGLNTPCLARYVQERITILEEIQHSHQLSRDDAKDICLATLFGGKRDHHPILSGIAQELSSLSTLIANTEKGKKILDVVKSDKEAKHRDPIASTLAIYVQDIERQILLHLDHFFGSKGRPFDSLIFDGGLIRKLEDETIPPSSLLREAEEWLSAQHGFRLSLACKPLSHSFVFQNNSQSILPASLVINDLYAARAFLGLMGDRLRNVGADLLVRLEDGRWRNDDSSLKKCVIPFAEKLVFRQEGPLGVKVFDFGGTLKTMNSMLGILPLITPPGPLPIQFEYQFASSADTEAVSVFLTLVSLVCNHKEDIKQYLLSYLAHIIQNPLDNPGVCLIFTGAKGCGKDTLFDLFMKHVLGPLLSFNYNKTEQLFENHDTGRMNKLMVKVEEAKRAVCIENADSLKSFITGKTQSFNPKNKPTTIVPSFNRFIFTTNGAIPVDFSEGERRFMISNCSPERVGDSEFWTAVYRTLDRPEAGKAIGEFLQTFDLSGFNARTIPLSEYQEAVRAEEVAPVDQWLEQAEFSDWQRSSDLFDLFNDFCRSRSIPPYRSSITLGRELMRLFRDGKIEQKRLRGVNWYKKPAS